MRALGTFAVVLACAAGGACTDTSGAMGADGGADSLDFTVGTISFHAASGAARVSGGVLSLYVTDQPDACLAITQAAVGQVVVLTLKVAAQTDGTTMASVVPPRTSPQPGEAVGNLAQLVGGATTTSYNAESGSVTWALNPDGSYGVTTMDVGFSGVGDRVKLGGVRLTTCP